MFTAATTKLKWFIAIILVIASAKHGPAQTNLPPAFDKKIPETIQDLQAIETHVQKLVEKVMPATVCLRVGNAQGSGVFIDREGRILTAGRVSGDAGREVTII